jgi:hypothetical protein
MGCKGRQPTLMQPMKKRRPKGKPRQQITVTWEYASQKDAKELIAEAIWLILNDRNSAECARKNLDNETRSRLSHRHGAEPR